MTRKQRRATLIGAGLSVLAVALGLVLYGLNTSINYFRTPSDVAGQTIPVGQRFRLGGLVKPAGIKRNGPEVELLITDTVSDATIVFRGELPSLVREGQSVVAEGRIEGDGRFRADIVLAKHDENYMPPEVAKALKAKGVKLGPDAVHPADKKLEPKDSKK